MKRKFLPPRFIKFKGEQMRVPGTTTNLSTIEFTKYLDQISALTGIKIPNQENV